MQKSSPQIKQDKKDKIKEDLQVFLIFDLGYSLLLLIALVNGYWDSFFGGLAGGLLFNLLFLREKYLGRKKKLGFKY